MPHFRVDDALHSHPKARQAGLEAMGLWNMCGSYCMGYLTDGFVPEWYVKSWPKGPALAKRLVAAKLWYPATKDDEKGWQFHEFTGPGRNDSREQIEESRKKWRDKKAGQRKDSPPVSPGDTSGDTQGEPSGDSLRVTRDPTQPNPTKNSGYVQTPPHQSNAHDRKTGAEVARRKFELIPSESSELAKRIVVAYSDSLDTPIDANTGREIAQVVDRCVQAGQSPEAIAAGMDLWAKSDSFAPSQIPKYVTKAAAGRRRNGVGKPTLKAAETQQLADEIIAEMEIP